MSRRAQHRRSSYVDILIRAALVDDLALGTVSPGRLIVEPAPEDTLCLVAAFADSATRCSIERQLVLGRFLFLLFHRYKRPQSGTPSL